MKEMEAWSVTAAGTADDDAKAKAKASGRKLGHPKGSLGVSRLDGMEDEIRHFLELNVQHHVARTDPPDAHGWMAVVVSLMPLMASAAHNRPVR